MKGRITGQLSIGYLKQAEDDGTFYKSRRENRELTAVVRCGAGDLSGVETQPKDANQRGEALINGSRRVASEAPPRRSPWWCSAISSRLILRIMNFEFSFFVHF